MLDVGVSPEQKLKNLIKESRRIRAFGVDRSQGSPGELDQSPLSNDLPPESCVSSELPASLGGKLNATLARVGPYPPKFTMFSPLLAIRGDSPKEDDCEHGEASSDYEAEPPPPEMPAVVRKRSSLESARRNSAGLLESVVSVEGLHDDPAARRMSSSSEAMFEILELGTSVPIVLVPPPLVRSPELLGGSPSMASISNLRSRGRGRPPIVLNGSFEYSDYSDPPPINPLNSQQSPVAGVGRVRRSRSMRSASSMDGHPSGAEGPVSPTLGPSSPKLRSVMNRHAVESIKSGDMDNVIFANTQKMAVRAAGLSMKFGRFGGGSESFKVQRPMSPVQADVTTNRRVSAPSDIYKVHSPLQGFLESQREKSKELRPTSPLIPTTPIVVAEERIGEILDTQSLTPNMTGFSRDSGLLTVNEGDSSSQIFGLSADVSSSPQNVKQPISGSFGRLRKSSVISQWDAGLAALWRSEGSCEQAMGGMAQASSVASAQGFAGVNVGFRPQSDDSTEKLVSSLASWTQRRSPGLLANSLGPALTRSPGPEHDPEFPNHIKELFAKPASSVSSAFNVQRVNLDTTVLEAMKLLKESETIIVDGWVDCESGESAKEMIWNRTSFLEVAAGVVDPRQPISTIAEQVVTVPTVPLEETLDEVWKCMIAMGFDEVGTRSADGQVSGVVLFTDLFNLVLECLEAREPEIDKKLHGEADRVFKKMGEMIDEDDGLGMANLRVGFLQQVSIQWCESFITTGITFLLLLIDICIMAVGDLQPQQNPAMSPSNAVAGTILCLFWIESLVRIFAHRLKLVDGSHPLDGLDVLGTWVAVIVFLVSLGGGVPSSVMQGVMLT